MKKFLALLFVCAGLTAMAITPRTVTNAPQLNKHVGKEVKLQNQVKATTPMVLKSNTFAKQVVDKALRPSFANPLTPQRFFRENNLTPEDNMLLKKGANRVATDDVTKVKIPFLEGYEYDSDGDSLALATECYQGGWDFQLEPIEGEANWYTGSLYFVAPQYYYVNAEEDWFALQTGVFIIDSVTTTADSVNWVMDGNTKRTKVYGDTTEYIIMVTEDYVFEQVDTLPDFIFGYFMSDGSMYLPDGFTYLVEYDINTTTETQTRVNPRAEWSESTITTVDTTEVYRITDFFRDTYILNATGTHTFDLDYYPSGTLYTDYVANVYMFQRNDSVIVWNLWGLGFPGNLMTVDQSAGTMTFPTQLCQTYDYTESKEYLEAQYPQYVSLFDWTDADKIINVDLQWDEEGDCIVLDSQYNEPIELDTEITGTVDENLTIKWNATNLSAYMNFNGNSIMVGGYYPFVHNVLSLLPAGPDFLRGDVNEDEQVNIADVTALIDFLLSGDFDSINYDNADCNLDGTVNIADVTALIDYLLAGTWPAAE